jgi:hypothetical protein
MSWLRLCACFEPAPDTATRDAGTSSKDHTHRVVLSLAAGRSWQACTGCTDSPARPRQPQQGRHGCCAASHSVLCRRYKKLNNPVVVSPDAGGVYRAKTFKEGAQAFAAATPLSPNSSYWGRCS